MARDETELLKHASRLTHGVAAHAMMLAELGVARQQRPDRIGTLLDAATDLVRELEIARFLLLPERLACVLQGSPFAARGGEWGRTDSIAAYTIRSKPACPRATAG